MKKFKKKIKILFLILGLFFALSCSRLTDSLFFKSQNKTHLNIKISFSGPSKSSNSESALEGDFKSLEEAYSSVERRNYVTSVRFVIHSSSFDQPIEIFETYNLGERPIYEPYSLSLSELEKSEILIQYLGNVSHPLRYGKRFFYGSVSLNLTQDAHHVEIKSKILNEFKKEILFGGRYIDEDLSTEDLTGKVVTYFHPPNGDPKIPLFEKEIFGGWFHLPLPTLKENIEEKAFFSYEMKKSGKKLFPFLNEEVFKKMDEDFIQPIKLSIENPVHLERENEIKIQVGGQIENIEEETEIKEEIPKIETKDELDDGFILKELAEESTGEDSLQEVLPEESLAEKETDDFKKKFLFLKISKPPSFEVPFEFLSLDPLLHTFVHPSDDLIQNSFFHQTPFFRKPIYSAYFNPEKEIYFGFFRKKESQKKKAEEIQTVKSKENKMCTFFYSPPLRRILNSFDVQKKSLSLMSHFFNPLVDEKEDSNQKSFHLCHSTLPLENLFSFPLIQDQEVERDINEPSRSAFQNTEPLTESLNKKVQETPYQDNRLDFITKNNFLNLQEVGHYSSKFFRFYGPFQLIDPNDFYQPFVKAYFIKNSTHATESDEIEESHDHIRLEWKFLEGLKKEQRPGEKEETQNQITDPLNQDKVDQNEFENSPSVLDGVSIFAQNIGEFESLFYNYTSLDFLNSIYFSSFYPSNVNLNSVSDLHSGLQKMGFLLLNSYKPDEAMTVSCDQLSFLGWQEIAHIEKDSFYEFTDNGNLDLKSTEGIKKARNWKFILCPYKRTNNKIQYYSSLVRKLKIGENTFEFERINHFSRKKPELLKESIISIENKNVLFTEDPVQGAYGRITNITEISPEEENINFNIEKDFTFILDIPNKKGDFKVGDELLLHVSNISSNESSSACNAYSNQPVPIGMWSLGQILKIENEKFYIQSDSFLKNINTQYLKSSNEESSFCFLQAVKVVELKKLHIKNGSLIAGPIDFKFGGGMIALRINEELHLEGGKIKANQTGFEARNPLAPRNPESILMDQIERTNQIEIFNSISAENLIENRRPPLIFGNSYIKESQKRTLEDGSGLSEDPPSENRLKIESEAQKRGGGIIFLAAKKVYLSKQLDQLLSDPFRSFQNTLEAKGGNEGNKIGERAGSIYFLTKKVEIKNTLEESKADDENDFGFSSLLLDASRTGGFIYSLSCSSKNIIPFVGKDLDTELLGNLLLNPNPHAIFYNELKKRGDKNWIQILLFPLILNRNTFSIQQISSPTRSSSINLLNTGFIKFQKLLCNPFFDD